MKTVHAVLLGLGICAAITLVGVGAIGWFLWHVGQDPADVVVSVEGPDSVAVGEEFVVTVVVHNQRTGQPFGLTDIDLADEYLAGFLILGTEPEAKSSTHVPLDNTHSHTFDTPVPAGETRRFGFRLRAVKPGVYRGDADVCEGARFLSALLQTAVREAK